MDPLTLLSLAGGAASLFSNKSKQPAYQQQPFTQQYQPGSAGPNLAQLPNAPQYNQDPQEQGTGNALFQSIVGKQLANYNAGQPILDQNYRNAVLNQAKRSFDLSANESSNQVNENFNHLNLLGATGHGQALGEVQRSRLQGLGNIEDNLTQQELGQLNNATNQGLSLQNAFQQRSNDQFRNNLSSADFARNNATTAFGAGMQQANFGQQERQNTFNNALSGYNANQRERQQAFSGAQQGADNQMGLGLGLLKIGADGLYNRGTGAGAGVVNGMRRVRSGMGGLGGVGGGLGGQL